MQITLFSFISALLWSSLLIIVIYFMRRTRFRPHFGVLTMVLLYLFCAARLLLPLEFPHTVIVSDNVVYPRIYSFLTRKPSRSHTCRSDCFCVQSGCSAQFFC